MPRRTLTVCLTLTAALALATAGYAGKFNAVLSVGDKAPSWSGLEGVDGKQHSLADYKDAKVLVQIFTCNHCPVAGAYEQRIIDLQKKYGKQGVQVVAISVSKLEADGLDEMKERAEKSGFNFPYLYDPTQQSARECGASTTPHTFVFDAQRNVAYMGAIDDSIAPERVEKHYLRDAIEALLAGKQPPVKETRQVGCGIQYEN